MIRHTHPTHRTVDSRTGGRHRTSATTFGLHAAALTGAVVPARATAIGLAGALDRLTGEAYTTWG